MNVLDHIQHILTFTLFRVSGQPITPYHLIVFTLTLYITAVVARKVRRLLELYFLRRLPVEAGAHNPALSSSGSFRNLGQKDTKPS